MKSPAIWTGRWACSGRSPTSQIKQGENRFQLTPGQRGGSTQDPILLDGLLLEMSHKA